MQQFYNIFFFVNIPATTAFTKTSVAHVISAPELILVFIRHELFNRYRNQRRGAQKHNQISTYVALVTVSQK